MIAAISSPATSNVSSYALPPSFTLPASDGRQHRQQMLDWDHEEPAARRTSAARGRGGAKPSRSEPTSERRPTFAGPRKMAELMPDVLARYGLKL